MTYDEYQQTSLLQSKTKTTETSTTSSVCLESTQGRLWDCPECGEQLYRRYNVVINRSRIFQPHFNSSLGKYVNTERDFANQVRKLEDEQTARSGYQVHLAKFDPREIPPVSEEGLDSTFRRQVEEGKREVRKWHSLK